MPSTVTGRHGTHHAIDWPTVHSRLALAQEALARDFEPPPEQWRAVLQQRAAALARAVDTAATPTPETEALCFALGEECFAIATRHIAEVYAIRDLSPLPCAPAFIAGLINLRGQVLSVVDLRVLLQLPREAGAIAVGKHAIVLHRDAMVFAVLADRIDGIQQLPDAELRPPPSLLRERSHDYLSGITPAGLSLIDGERLLTDARLIVDEEVPT